MVKKHILEVGDNHTEIFQATDDSVQLFAQATGDNQPIHLDDAAARTSRFGRRIAHGVLILGYVSAILGTKFPGEGTIYVEQKTRWINPVYIGDEVEITVIIKEIYQTKRNTYAILDILCERSSVLAPLLIMEGTATVILP